MRKLLKGIQIPHHKKTSGMPAVRLPVPGEVEIPMSMHIGAPAKPVVKAGDTVKVGQLIAEAGGFVSAPVHSSVSGTVKRIGELLQSNGRKGTSILIQTDGLQSISEDVRPPKVDSLQDFLDAVRASGIVGLGGAGFPTAVKLTVKDLDRIEAVIINGAECEPYITSDTRTMLDASEDLMAGARMIRKYLKVPRIIFGIEDNKKECIDLYRRLTGNEPGMEVQTLKAMYPQGGEKVLIYHTTGRIVPEGKLPLDVGVIVINCTTLASIARYCVTGMPLVEKWITVDGSAVKNPQNVIAPIGMRMEDVFAACGGFREEQRKVLYGGPMMGISVPDLKQPILKNTNAILAFGAKEAVPPPTTACIKCGRCISTCPLNLMPVEIERAYNLDKVELLDKLKVNICMECGCCSYGCPANRPLVQTNKLAKARLMAWRAEQKAQLEAKKEAEK